MSTNDNLDNFKEFEKDIQTKFILPEYIPKEYQRKAYCNYLPFRINENKAKNINKDNLYLSATESDKSGDEINKREIYLGQHKQTSFYESYAREIIFQLFKYPLMSFFNYEYTITYKWRFNHSKWLDEKKNINGIIGSNQNCESSSNTINNNISINTSDKENNFNNPFPAKDKNPKKIKTSKKKKEKKNGLMVSFKLNSEEEKKNEFSNIESSDVDNKYFSSKEDKKDYINDKNKNIKKLCDISVSETLPSSMNKNNTFVENKIKNSKKKKGKKIKRNKSLPAIHINQLNKPHLKKYLNSEKENNYISTIKTETIKGNHDFLIHSLNGTVLEEVLVNNKKIAPFVFYGNFTVDKSKQYDIIGEIKENSKDNNYVINQFEKYHHFIRCLKKSDELNKKLFFKKSNTKIIMYVFNSSYHCFIKDILDFKINRDKFKEMEYYKKFPSHEKIVKSFVEKKEGNNKLMQNIIESGIPFVMIFVQHLMKFQIIKQNSDLNEKVEKLEKDLKENTKISVDNLRKEMMEQFKKQQEDAKIQQEEAKRQLDEYLKVIKKLSESLEIKELEIKRLKEDSKVEEKNSAAN